MIYCDFSETFRQLRKNRNLTQKELGAKIGLSKAVISKYENGMAYPTFDMLIQIAQYFGVTTDYLLGVAESKTINISALTDSQATIIQQLVTEFTKSNKNGS